VANSERISVKKCSNAALRRFLKRSLDTGDVEITDRGSRLLTGDSLFGDIFGISRSDDRRHVC
jgi:hypothetical protein